MNKNIVVPERIMKAAQQGNGCSCAQCRETRSKAVEAALIQLDGELEGMSHAYAIQQKKRGYPLSGDSDRLSGFDEAIRRVRTMFRAPEPQVPEAIKDLVERWGKLGNKDLNYPQAELVEAYRRGQRNPEGFHEQNGRLAP